MASYTGKTEKTYPCPSYLLYLLRFHMACYIRFSAQFPWTLAIPAWALCSNLISHDETNSSSFSKTPSLHTQHGNDLSTYHPVPRVLKLAVLLPNQRKLSKDRTVNFTFMIVSPDSVSKYIKSCYLITKKKKDKYYYF